MSNSSDLWYPRSTSADGKRLIATRALRGLGDGIVSVLLPSYLTAIGFSLEQNRRDRFRDAVRLRAGDAMGGIRQRRIGTAADVARRRRLMVATGLGFTYARSSGRSSSSHSSAR